MKIALLLLPAIMLMPWLPEMALMAIGAAAMWRALEWMAYEA